MKRLILLLPLLLILLTGCVNSQITERTIHYVNNIKVKEVIKTYPAPHAVKSLTFGIDIGIDENKIPRVRFGITKYEYIVGNDKSFPLIYDNYKDINLLLGSGSANSIMEITKIK